MESNIAGYPNYHVTKIGDVYRIGKDKVRKIRKLHSDSYTGKYLTERFGISKSSVSKIIHYRQWPEE